jgi:hypothetical protein
LGFGMTETPADAQFAETGSKLVGTGATGAANEGNSVSLSANGTTAIVGGYGDNDGLGAAWVFTCLGGVWSQQGSKLVGAGAADAAQQGYSVALSADGSTALVGAPNDNNGLGAAWAFTRSGGVWRQQGSKLVGTGAAGGANQGYSIALSADGNTAVVGGYCDNNGLGSRVGVHAFERRMEPAGVQVGRRGRRRRRAAGPFCLAVR